MLLLMIAHNSLAQAKAGFTADVTSGCAPLVVKFQDQSSGTPTQWLWNLGNGTISTQQHPTTTYFSPGTYQVSLVIKATSGADSTTHQQFITVHANPAVSFTLSDSTGCSPATILFTDISDPVSGSILSRIWDFGDGSISTQQQPQHTYSKEGNYSVTLKVTNSFGCQKVISRPELVKLQNIKSDFTYTSGGTCARPMLMSFNTNLVQASSFQWSFGDGTVSTLPSPSHEYQQPGTYPVKLVVQNSQGCRDSIVRNVTVGSVAADFSVPAIICAGSPVEFENTSSPSPVSTTWSFSDGVLMSTNNATRTFTAAGTFQVKLIVNFGGCTDTVIKSITVNPSPSAAFTPTGNLQSCSVPAVVNFQAAAAGLTYQWTFGDGNSETKQQPSHTYTTFGEYHVQLVTTNIWGCTDTLLKNNLITLTPPRIKSVSGISYQGCAPYEAGFSAVVDAVDPVTAWRWHFGDGTTSGDAAPKHLYSSPGSYTVKLVITTLSGCTDSLAFTDAIRISNKPVADFSASPPVVCAAGSVQFSNLSTGASDWLWLFGANGFSTEKNPSHQFGDTGSFTITLVATNMGCSDTLIRKNYVRNDPPIGRINIIQDCSDPYQVQFRDSSSGGQTYKWKFGDGDSSTLQHPAHRYTTPGTYTVDFIVFHGACQYPLSRTINIIDEKPVLAIADSAVCRNVPVRLTANNINPSYIQSYQWNLGDGNIVTTTVPYLDYIFTRNGTFYPALVTTNILGCADTATQQPIVRVYGPTAKFSNIEGACVNSTVYFTDESSSDGRHPISQWHWDYGNGITGTHTASQTFTQPYSNPGSYSVSLKVVDAIGCSDTFLKSAAILITKPAADFTSSDSIKCSSDPVHFTNGSKGLDLTYQWMFGNGSSYTIANPSHTFGTEGTHAVSLKVTDRFGCVDSVTKKQVIANPHANFIASDTFSSCPPLMVNLTNNSSAFTAISWDFDDGGRSDLGNPSHYYTYPGNYKLKLVVKGYGTCTDSVSKNIIVKGPVGSFKFQPAEVCAGVSVTLKASSKDNAKFLWDFSDGLTAFTTDSSVTHTYDVPGNYNPRLILIDTAGCEVPVISPDTLKVRGVKAKFQAGTTQLCDSGFVSFTDSSIINNDQALSYQWQFGDGTYSVTHSPTHHYNRVGIFTPRLIVTTAAGCSDTTTLEKRVSVLQGPQVTLASSAAVCQDDSISFRTTISRTGDSPLSWNWDLGNGSQPGTGKYITSFAVPGPKQVKVIVTETSGCSDTATASILVHPLPKVMAGTDTMICRGNSYILQPTGAASYEWISGSGIDRVNVSSSIVKPVSTTAFHVKGISEFGCSATDSVIVTVMQPFKLNTSRPDTLCAGESVQLKANGAPRYNWFPATGLSNSSIANPVAKPAATTTYMVIGTDQLNCFNDTGYVKISVFPVPEFNIVDQKVSIAAGSTVRLATTSSADINRWKWYPSAGLSCDTCPQPVITAKDDILYRVEASNDGGCTTTDNIAVTVICNNGNVFIPNTFSPNNDGMNDVFYPRGKGISSVRHMKIFNRWGELVFEKNDFTANDPNAGWNGNSKGVNLTPDVYVYIVDVVCDNSAVFTLKGNVTLLR